MKRNTIDCSDFLSNQLKGKIKQTRNYITKITGEFKNDNNNSKGKRRRNNSNSD